MFLESLGRKHPIDAGFADVETLGVKLLAAPIGVIASRLQTSSGLRQTAIQERYEGTA